MSYWAAAQLENNRVSLALHCLKLSGYRVYAPRLRTYRVSHGGRRVEERPLLFPSYAFVLVVTGLVAGALGARRYPIDHGGRRYAGRCPRQRH